MTSTTTPSRIHPLMAAAAASVILVSLVGAAAITGILPNSHSTTTPVVTASAPQMASATDAQALAAAQNTSASANTAVQPHTTATHKIHKAHTAAQAETDYNNTTPVQTARAQQICYNCGTVESVHAITQPAQQGSGVGAVAGALLGGVLGNQVGSGNGRKLATVAGAVGGSLAGNEIEKRTHGNTSSEVRVRMEDGSMRTVTVKGAAGWNVGERVKIVDGNIVSQG